MPIPCEDEDVITLAPDPAAPYTMFIAETSDSAWTNTPPTLGNSLDIYSGNSFCGIIGYPKKYLQPDSIAALPKA